MLEFNIKNQTISRIDRFNPATDSVDYLTAKFNFLTTDWDGITKRALFRSGTVSYDAAINASGVCNVPWEVLVSPENKFSALSGGCIKIFVSVVGTSGTIQIPTKECRVEIGASGLNETINGAAPTPNIYEQFVDTIKADNDVTVAEIKADNDETRAEVEALATRAETAKTSAEQSAASMKNDYANALKGTASGEVVRVDDVSPVEHTAKVKISGDIDPSTVTLSRCGKNLTKYPYSETDKTRAGITYSIFENGVISYSGTSTGSYLSLATIEDKNLYLSKGVTYTISGLPAGSSMQTVYAHITENDGETRHFLAEGKTTFTAAVSGYAKFSIVVSDGTTVSNQTFKPMLEIGNAANNFEPYNGATYTPADDGTCDIVSVSPTMTLITDTEGVTVDLEYNRDINKVIADILKKVGA